MPSTEKQIRHRHLVSPPAVRYRQAIALQTIPIRPIPIWPTRRCADFALLDQAGKHWRLSEHLDAAAMLVFLRGDW